MKRGLNRRRLLKGMFNGAAVTVALPLLDIFLNENATALADGAPLPIRFGTWFWGCGMTPQLFTPGTFGADYEITPQMEPLMPFRDKFSLLSNFDVKLDGAPNLPHRSGLATYRTGSAPKDGVDYVAQTFDNIIASKISARMRFKSLEVTAIGNPRNSISYNSTGINPAISSVLELYNRLFGPDFQDPNSTEFIPNPLTMAEKSALSMVAEERKKLLSQVGANDRERLDQYFTAVREMENQLDIMLTKPEPVKSCIQPTKPEDIPTGNQIEQVIKNHRVMAQLIAMALACNQTAAFNMMFNDPVSSLQFAGDAKIHHVYTHEEADDLELGYQTVSTKFSTICLKELAVFVKTLDSISEGDGTLLDNMVVLAHSDCSIAKVHAPENIPSFVFGGGGGRIRTGLHIDGKKTSASRIGLTMQNIMGVSPGRWGTGSMETNQDILELIA